VGDAGVPVLAVHNDADDVVPPSYSRAYAGQVASAEYGEVAGAHHFDVVDPAHESWSRVTGWLGEHLPAGVSRG
jgi:fermentation-respiration switch protein FrsA (DUF1100 family)